MCCFGKEIPYGFISDAELRNLLHGEAIVSPNAKFISSIIKKSEYFGEEILKKANNRCYAPDEFNADLKNLNLASQLFYIDLNISYFITTLSNVIYFLILKLQQI